MTCSTDLAVWHGSTRDFQRPLPGKSDLGAILWSQRAATAASDAEIRPDGHRRAPRRARPRGFASAEGGRLRQRLGLRLVFAG
jgi:hypothetical protein